MKGKFISKKIWSLDLVFLLVAGAETLIEIKPRALCVLGKLSTMELHFYLRLGFSKGCMSITERREKFIPAFQKP